MQVLVFDTETALFRPGKMAPKLACVTWKSPGLPTGIAHGNDAYLYLYTWLNDPDTILAGHNIAYDMAVVAANYPDLIPAIFKAYDEDRVTDTMIRQKLLDIAQGTYRGGPDDDGYWRKWGYSLTEINSQNFGAPRMDKDTWRLGYGDLIPLPLSQWPQGAIDYAKLDADVTLANFEFQEEYAQALPDQYHQARSAFTLHLCEVWGLRTRASEVQKLRARTEEAYEALRTGLVEAGLVRKSGVRDTKAAKARMVQAMAALREKPRLTKKGGICLDEDACEASEDDLLIDYGHLTKLKTVLSKDIPALLKGCLEPIHTSFNLATTGRTTSSKPNVQNWGRDGDARACFVPRQGMVYAQADFDQLELHTLAQRCLDLFGESRLAEVLNTKRPDGKPRDPHTEFAAEILGISLDEAYTRKKDKSDKEFEDARACAKAANFALPGGLGIAKFVLFARKTYNVVLTPEKATDLKRLWLQMWPEMKRYFSYVSNMCANEDGLARVVHPNGRIQGGCKYTAACNTGFQGLGSDCAKRALWYVVRACYVDQASPLFGSRVVNFIHDEIIAETPDNGNAHNAAQELARLMLKGCNEFLPNVPCKTEPVLMRFWSKKAVPLFKDGKLIPWEGDEAA